VLERLANVLQRVQLVEPAAAHSAPGDAVDPTCQGISPFEEDTPEVPIQLNRHEQQRHQRREKRKALFEAVRAAYQRGLTKRAIARELGITRTTIRRFLKAGEFPERAPRRQRCELDSFREYLEKRWAEGCHNASQLCRELRQRGYGGQRSRVKEYVQPWRAKSSPPVSKPRRTLPNLRLVAFWLTKAPMQRSPDEQRWVEAVNRRSCSARHGRAPSSTIPHGIQGAEFRRLEVLAGERSGVGDPRAKVLRRWSAARLRGGRCRGRTALEQWTSRGPSPPP
jgi:predicted transcriptional regulator